MGGARGRYDRTIRSATTSGRCALMRELTQTEFAKRLQVSQTTRFRRGRRSSSQPRRSNLFICSANFPASPAGISSSEKNGLLASLFAARAIRNLSKHRCSGAWRQALHARRVPDGNTSLCRIRCTSVTRTRSTCGYRAKSMNRVLPNGCHSARCARGRARVCVQDGERLHGEACKASPRTMARSPDSISDCGPMEGSPRRRTLSARDRAGGVIHHAGEIPV